MHNDDRPTNHRLAKRRYSEDEGRIIRLATKQFPCSTCGASPGQVCHSVRGSGNDYAGGVYAHKARRFALDTIWMAGYEFGYGRGLKAKRIRKVK